jgi:hypothetical protein
LLQLEVVAVLGMLIAVKLVVLAALVVEVLQLMLVVLEFQVKAMLVDKVLQVLAIKAVVAAVQELLV